jgi:hypothetical protein
MTNDLIARFIVVPFLAVLGIFVVGAAIGSFLHIGNAFAPIFIAAGGITTIGLYFKRQLNR